MSPEPYPRPLQVAPPRSVPSHCSAKDRTGHDGSEPEGALHSSRTPLPHSPRMQLGGSLQQTPLRPPVPEEPPVALVPWLPPGGEQNASTPPVPWLEAPPVPFIPEVPPITEAPPEPDPDPGPPASGWPPPPPFPEHAAIQPTRTSAARVDVGDGHPGRQDGEIDIPLNPSKGRSGRPPAANAESGGGATAQTRHRCPERALPPVDKPDSIARACPAMTSPSIRSCAGA